MPGLKPVRHLILYPILFELRNSDFAPVAAVFLAEPGQEL
jgi:hypothetical protein